MNVLEVLGAVASVGVAWTVGLAVCRVPGLLGASVSLVVGLGVLSQVQCLLLWWGWPVALWPEWGLLALALASFKRWPLPKALTPVGWGHWADWLSVGVMGLAAVIAFQHLWAMPLGNGDAITNWMPKARFIFAGEGDAWRNLFSPLFPPWMHADYPLMLPLSVVRSWLYTGQMGLLGPIVLHGAVFLSVLGMVWSAVRHLSGPVAALLAVLLLGSMPHTYFNVSLQYGDLLLMAALTAGVSLSLLQERAAGFAWGLTAWAKNEGWLMAVLAALLLKARWRMGLVLLVPLGYKLFWAQANDIVSGARLSDGLALWADTGRWALLAQHAWGWFWNSEAWFLTPWVVGGVWLWRRPWHPLVGVMGLLIAGYVGALLWVPAEYDYAWFLHFSLDRVLYQLWPSLVVLGLAEMR
jgi:hypothetical protein